MKENKNQYHSIYIKKSVSKSNSNTNFTQTENNSIAVKKLMNNNVSPQTFYKPITRIIPIETDVSKNIF